LWERVLSGVAAKRVRGMCQLTGTAIACRRIIPLTRLNLVSLDLATLSHKGRGK
jgi:hypothetical protein